MFSCWHMRVGLTSGEQKKRANRSTCLHVKCGPHVLRSIFNEAQNGGYMSLMYPCSPLCTRQGFIYIPPPPKKMKFLGWICTSGRGRHGDLVPHIWHEVLQLVLDRSVAKSSVLITFFCCFVARAIQIYCWVSRKWICESVLIHHCCSDKMFQSIAVPCCHGRPHGASWRDWTEGLDELLLYCKDSGHTEFSVHFMCRRHYSIANT